MNRAFAKLEDFTKVASDDYDSLLRWSNRLLALAVSDHDIDTEYCSTCEGECVERDFLQRARTAIDKLR